MVAWACVRVGWVALEAELEVEISGVAPDFALSRESAGALSLRRATWRATVGKVGKTASPLLSLLCELPIPAGESICQPILGVYTAAFADCAGSASCSTDWHGTCVSGNARIQASESGARAWGFVQRRCSRWMRSCSSGDAALAGKASVAGGYLTLHLIEVTHARGHESLGVSIASLAKEFCESRGCATGCAFKRSTNTNTPRNALKYTP